MTGLKLFIVHSHYRPGGVRRVIELATPHVAAALNPPASEVVLLGGEPPEQIWLERFRNSMPGVRVTCAIEPALGYISEQRTTAANLMRRIRAHLRRCLARNTAESAVVWAHNPGLGRNLIVTRALQEVCAGHGLALVFHHHDWWFDNRWARWPEMRQTGFRTLAAVAETVFPVAPNIRHAAINHADATVLRRHLKKRAGWLPNPAAPAALPAAARVRHARRWLAQRIGGPAPVWLLPCRLLRRKNVAEALLLTRWLRPEAWLVTTGGVSSADEVAYARALERAARRHGWKLRLGVLADRSPRNPTVDALLAASETILLTSLQEGFGLPNLEAAAAGRPLIARRLPTIATDLARFGFQFPQSYDDILIDPALFDGRTERLRQRQRSRAWIKVLPRAVREMAGKPALLSEGEEPGAIPFSRLTLSAQLEVLARPPGESWERCAPLNPFLVRWQRRISGGGLRVSRWPRTAGKWLSGEAYAGHFSRLLRADPTSTVEARAGEKVADDFIRAKLAGKNQYPLLWTAGP